MITSNVDIHNRCYFMDMDVSDVQQMSSDLGWLFTYASLRKHKMSRYKARRLMFFAYAYSRHMFG
jgi:hypothetical protein